jgi:hypothetical protein
MVARILAAILVTGLLLVVLAMVLSDRPRVDAAHVPWNVEVSPDGSTRVFGVRLGHTPLRQFERRFGVQAKLALFVAPPHEPTLEAYLNNARIGPFVVKLVAGLAADHGQLKGFHRRAGEREAMPSGALRYSLSPRDAASARDLSIVHITYAPTYVRLEPSRVRQRFGVPDSVQVPKPGTTIWFYPAMGVAVTMVSQARDVIHYVAPREFGQLRQRLLGVDAAQEETAGPLNGPGHTR